MLHPLCCPGKERGDEYQDSNQMQGILRVCGRGGCEVNGAEARTAEPLSSIRDEELVREEFPDVVILADAYHKRAETIKEAAARLKGFSAREVAKLCISLQTHIFSEVHVLVVFDTF